MTDDKLIAYLDSFSEDVLTLEEKARLVALARIGAAVMPVPGPPPRGTDGILFIEAITNQSHPSNNKRETISIGNVYGDRVVKAHIPFSALPKPTP